MTEDWGRGAHDALGDWGASGLHLVRKVVEERIGSIDPDDPTLSDYIEGLAALEVVLTAIGKLQPRQGTETPLQKEITRFVLAAQDMEWAATAAETLIADSASGSSHALEVGMVVCYARPFSTSYWIGRLGAEWLPKGEDDRQLHRALFRLRNKWAAHTDEESGRRAEDIGLMLGGESLFAASWRSGIRPEILPGIQRLCELQRVRFTEERQRLEAQLPRE
jgi:hypothetical protein